MVAREAQLQGVVEVDILKQALFLSHLARLSELTLDLQVQDLGYLEVTPIFVIPPQAVQVSLVRLWWWGQREVLRVEQAVLQREPLGAQNMQVAVAVQLLAGVEVAQVDQMERAKPAVSALAPRRIVVVVVVAEEEQGVVALQ